jgi:hypothetical protein
VIFLNLFVCNSLFIVISCCSAHNILVCEVATTSCHGVCLIFHPLVSIFLRPSFCSFVCVYLLLHLFFVAVGDLVVSVLATGPKVRGFKSDRGRWILRVIKSAARLPSEGK